MQSILNFPSRGSYGNSNYRGNCSGHVIKELIEHFKPSLFVDVCEGSGTSGAVCAELRVPYVGLDLHKKFDFTKDSVIKKVGKAADIVFSHPPYHDMISYEAERLRHNLGGGSGNDLSSCLSAEEFIEKSQLMLLNQREATASGGIYTSLIGDYRKNGKFYSFQSDFIKMMPTSELISVTIKLQHNTFSDRKSYQSKNFIPILHEYLLIWKKNQITLAQIAWEKASEMQQRGQMTWRNFIRQTLMDLGGEAPLDKIYSQVEKVASDKIKNNSHYKEKIRQQLQMHFVRVSNGVWSLNGN